MSAIFFAGGGLEHGKRQSPRKGGRPCRDGEWPTLHLSLRQDDKAVSFEEALAKAGARQTGSYGGRVPAFIRRYNENWDRVAPDHFSVISELAIRLWGRLEMVGHTMADRAPSGTENRPDVSVGRLFADWLEEEHPEHAGRHKMYS